MLKCQKFSQPAGGYPPQPPPGTLPPCLNPLGVDTYEFDMLYLGIIYMYVHYLKYR